MPLKTMQGVIQRGMCFENGCQVCQLQQILDLVLGTGQLDRTSAGLGPHQHQDQFAKARAVYRLHTAELDNQPPRARKKIGDSLGESRGFVAIADPSVTIKNRDAINSASVKMQLQLRPQTRL
jgi:hypothetical protein